MLYKSRKKCYWFTLVEVILVCTVFAILVSWIILAINRTFVFMNNTRLSIRATNFAREWIEMMYNLRDTNRRRCSWEKDKAWLYLGTGSSTTNCEYEDNKLFSNWIYILSEGITGDNKYIYASRPTILSPEDYEEFYSSEWFFKSEFNSIRNDTKLNFSWTYKYLSWDTVETWEVSELLWEWVDFYRVVRVYGIYKKTAEWPDTPADEAEIKYWSPAEMRFCVKVFYQSNWSKQETELCSIITNFME